MRLAGSGTPAAVKRRTVEAVNKVKILPVQAIRNNDGTSGYSNHILSTGHTCGSVTDTMNIIKTEKRDNT
jgi:hypothetical protein